MDSTNCWNEIVRELEAGSVRDITPAAGKPFTAVIENGEIAIYLGETKWRNVSKEQFDDYFEWYDYCASHNFDRASRNEMKNKIRDVAISSSYIFALIKRHRK